MADQSLGRPPVSVDVAGGNIDLQSTNHFLDRHAAIKFTNPHMDARFRLVVMPADTKSGIFHEICGEKTCNRRDNPPVPRHIACADTEFHALCFAFSLQPRTP